MDIKESSIQFSLSPTGHLMLGGGTNDLEQQKGRRQGGCNLLCINGLGTYKGKMYYYNSTHGKKNVPLHVLGLKQTSATK